ncbi:MAG: oligosaccharide flippase family protein, partial [Bacteroidota bacterium]
MSNPLKKLAGQTAVYGLGTILPRLINFLLNPFLTYTFAAAEFGINNELFSYISFMNVIFTYGMETTFFNFSSKMQNKEEVYNTSFMSLLFSTAVFSLLLLAFASQIANGLSTPNAVYLPQFIVWSILIIASDAIAIIPFARLRSENKAMHFSILKLVNVCVTFGLTIFFLKVCKGSYDACEDNFYAALYNPQIGIGYSFLALLISNCLTLILLSKQFMRVQFMLNKALLKEMLIYAWPLVILGLAAMVNDTLDKIIIKTLMADKAAAQVAQGIYGGCNKIAVLMSIFIQAFRFASEPFFFGKAKEKDSKQTYAIVMKYFVIFCLLLFLGTTLNLDWIKYIVGKEYRSGMAVVPILLMAYLCLGVMYNLSIWYKLSGKTKFGAIIALSGASITILINVVFIPKYSYMACAWATFAAYSSMMVLSYFLGQKYFPIKYNIRAMTVYAIITLALYFVAGTYANMQNIGLKLLLNNLLILLFVWV